MWANVKSVKNTYLANIIPKVRRLTRMSRDHVITVSPLINLAEYDFDEDIALHVPEVLQSVPRQRRKPMSGFKRKRTIAGFVLSFTLIATGSYLIHDS